MAASYALAPSVATHCWSYCNTHFAGRPPRFVQRPRRDLLLPQHQERDEGEQQQGTQPTGEKSENTTSRDTECATMSGS